MDNPASTDMFCGNGTKENLHLGTKISAGTSKIHILTQVIYMFLLATHSNPVNRSKLNSLCKI